MTRRSLVAAAFALIGTAAVADDHPVPPPLAKAPPTAFECRWADSPITLDGAADEPAWKHAQVIDAFHLPWLGDQARMSRTATKARLLWDRDYLYFFADLEDGDLFADVTEHDGNTWLNDVFELFIRPDRTKPGYYEFQVNAAGTTFDCFFPKPGFDDFDRLKKAQDFHIDARVKLRGTLNKRDDKDGGWSVEGRIPWSDFLLTGGRPEPGETWALNLCRFDYHKDWKDPEMSCVAPIRQKKLSAFFHQTEDYATVTFVGVDRNTAAGPFGIAERVPVTTCTVAGFPDPPPPYRPARAFPDFRPGYPIMAKLIPGGSDYLLLTQPRSYGPTTLFRFNAGTTDQTVVKVLDTPGEGTAYDIAFHPKFADNGYVYIGWNGPAPGKKGKHSQVTRYTMKPAAPFDLDPKSETTIIAWESDGHNGAAVCFGNDGLMYVTSGDGTSDSDTNLMGQRTDVLLAKVLRIDVDHPAADKQYSVPKDNPFVADKRFAPETWAYGLRNPWRIACDPKTGHVWVGQNGQDLWEQAYFVRKGDNYGWSVTEGSHPFYPTRQAGPTPIVKPTVEHHHSEARSLTGGIVYHGSKLKDLQGAYIYGDYSTGRIWAVKHDGTAVVWHREIAVTTLKITGFTTDAAGELLVFDHDKAGSGGFYTLEPNPAAGTVSAFPRRLSDSGLFDSVQGHRMKPGVIPYSVNAPFWSDGLHKERWLALPAGESIKYTRTRGWDFPDRTVLVKSFAVEEKEGDPASRKWVETRFLTRHAGEWFGYSYVWNDEQTDAVLVDAKGLDKVFTVTTPVGPRPQAWHYPSRSECLVCHSRAQNFVLGLCEVQMNRDFDYGGSRVENQLRAFERLGLLKCDWAGEGRGRVEAAADAKGLKGKVRDAYLKANGPQPGQRDPKTSMLLPRPPEQLKRLVDPYDKTQDLTLRARSWLHANCSSCHVEAGGGNAQMELEFDTALDKMRVLDVKPLHQAFGLPDAKLIAPGSPERSVVLHRLGTRGPGQMPPLASSRVDSEGLELMREWCRSLK
ncbi:MAG: PQQ-dependent sugar dehydrogenase [Gemmataceae bacterium]|nr:PQQ-dependent sugar dehydrogenase [Gemmataceae bacterium]